MEWRAIEGYEGKYAVSDGGEVMSMNFAKSGLPGIMRFNLSRGYLAVQLGDRKRYTVHRLVAEAFIGPRPTGMHINHKDGNKKNNSVSNLEYVTPSENQKHSFAIGLQDNHGERHSQAKLTNAKVAEIKRMFSLGFSNKELAAFFHVCPTNIAHIRAGRIWSTVPAANPVEGGVPSHG